MQDILAYAMLTFVNYVNENNTENTFHKYAVFRDEINR